MQHQDSTTYRHSTSTAPVQSDWNATSGLAQILNKPTIPSAYTLPAASTSTLGGVIPDGTTITVDANGNIAAAPGGYVLPMASPTVLGGIKIGTGLSIDAGGVVTVASGGSAIHSKIPWIFIEFRLPRGRSGPPLNQENYQNPPLETRRGAG